MANEEHLTRLKEGVEAWNQWREANSHIRPDLSGFGIEDLSFSESELMGINFQEANLDAAFFVGCRLQGVNFHKATLWEANFEGAQLQEVDLTWAELLGTRFVNTNLQGANLDKALMGWTVLGDIDLSTVHGLDTVRHDGPSTMGIDTLYRSHGCIPEAFLRGAGVPEDFIPTSNRWSDAPSSFTPALSVIRLRIRSSQNASMPTCKIKECAAGFRQRTFRAAEPGAAADTREPLASLNFHVEAVEKPAHAVAPAREL